MDCCSSNLFIKKLYFYLHSCECRVKERNRQMIVRITTTRTRTTTINEDDHKRWCWLSEMNNGMNKMPISSPNTHFILNTQKIIFPGPPRSRPGFATNCNFCNDCNIEIRYLEGLTRYSYSIIKIVFFKFFWFWLIHF